MISPASSASVLQSILVKHNHRPTQITHQNIPRIYTCSNWETDPSLEVNVISFNCTFMLSSTLINFPLYKIEFLSSIVTMCPCASCNNFTGTPMTIRKDFLDLNLRHGAVQTQIKNFTELLQRLGPLSVLCINLDDHCKHCPRKRKVL